MNRSRLLAETKQRAEGHIARVSQAVERLTDGHLNASVNGEWSIAQILRHLQLGNEPYLRRIEEAMANGAKAEDHDVQHGLLGRLIMKASGPGGNAPPPKFMVPEERRYERSIVSEWREQQERFVRLLDGASGLDLRVRVRHPFLRLFRMRLVDLFGVLDVHTERHVQQIEQRARKAC